MTHLILPLLYLLFLALLIIRARRSETRREEVADLFRRPLRQSPGILVQTMGGLLLVVGIAVAFGSGRVAPVTTVHGLVGAAMMVCGLLLLNWSMSVFKSWRFQAKLGPDHELCTTGPYAWLRHPMYLALDLLALGSLVWVPVPLVAVGVLLILVGGDMRARAEEKLLLERFGDRYGDYAKRVRRLIPGVY